MFGVSTLWQARCAEDEAREHVLRLDAMDVFTRYGTDSDEAREALARLREARLVREVYVSVTNKLEAVGA